jgi:hypothetical protein
VDIQQGSWVTWNEADFGGRAGRVVTRKTYRGADYVLVAPEQGSIRAKWLTVACVQKAETAALAAAS